jgi:hypothetical protein
MDEEVEEDRLHAVEGENHDINRYAWAIESRRAAEFLWKGRRDSRGVMVTARGPR